MVKHVPATADLPPEGLTALGRTRAATAQALGITLSPPGNETTDIAPALPSAAMPPPHAELVPAEEAPEDELDPDMYANWWSTLLLVRDIPPEEITESSQRRVIQARPQPIPELEAELSPFSVP